MTYLYKQEVKEQNLYSELIDSYITAGTFCRYLGQPVPGEIAVRILLKNLYILKDSLIVVKGFPNSAEQLLVWEEEVGEQMPLPKTIYFENSPEKVKEFLDQQKYIFFYCRLSNAENLVRAVAQNATHL